MVCCDREDIETILIPLFFFSFRWIKTVQPNPREVPWLSYLSLPWKGSISPLSFTYHTITKYYGVRQIRSVAQSCPTLFDPMNRSTPGLPVHHQLPEFTQTHVHRVSDAIQPSHPLSSPSPPSPNPSQHLSLFQWVNSSHEVAKVLEFQLLHHSFQRNPRADLLQNGLVGSPCSPWDSRVFSNTTVQKHQFFGAQPSSQSNSHIHTWPLEKQ